MIHPVGHLILGDCMEVMPTMAAQSIDLVLTDPPFFVPARHYAARKEWPRSLSDLAMLVYYYRSVFEQLRRILKDDGHLLMFCDAQSYPVFYTCAYPHFANLFCLVWDKGSIGLGMPWRNQHELILAGCGRGSKLTATQGNVLQFRRVPSADRLHPAQKPVDLLEHLIRLTTTVPAAVCDPFMGVGSTGAAAHRSGRNFVGIEMNPYYHAVADEWLGDLAAMGLSA
jgi:DNA modification methylase